MVRILYHVLERPMTGIYLLLEPDEHEAFVQGIVVNPFRADRMIFSIQHFLFFTVTWQVR